MRRFPRYIHELPDWPAFRWDQESLAGTLAGVLINARQRLMLNRLLDGFEGKLTTSKWATIAKCSSDTALRDLLALLHRGVLVRNPGAGRSTSYSLAQPR